MREEREREKVREVETRPESELFEVEVDEALQEEAFLVESAAEGRERKM